MLVAVRNGKVELGQIGTAFLRAFLLDPLNAHRSVKSPAPGFFTLSAQLRKPHKVDPEGLKELGGQRTGGFASWGWPHLAHHPSLELPFLPCPVASQGKRVSTCGLLWRSALPYMLTCFSTPPNRLLSDFAVRDAILFVFPSDTISPESFWSRELCRGCRLQENCA